MRYFTVVDSEWNRACLLGDGRGDALTLVPGEIRKPQDLTGCVDEAVDVVAGKRGRAGQSSRTRCRYEHDRLALVFISGRANLGTCNPRGVRETDLQTFFAD